MSDPHPMRRDPSWRPKALAALLQCVGTLVRCGGAKFTGYTPGVRDKLLLQPVRMTRCDLLRACKHHCRASVRCNVARLTFLHLC